MKLEEVTLPPGMQDIIVFDDKLPGFGVRLRASGDKKWIVQYKKGQKCRRITLGSTAVLKPAEARAKALKLLAAVRLGGDPAAERRGTNNLHQYIAAKALAFLEQDIEPACYLYRHYHPNGDLLYVGISLEPLRRQDHHTKAAGWRNMICQIVIEPFATREQALAAEKSAIRSEFPRFNTTHNSHRHPTQELTKNIP